MEDKVTKLRNKSQWNHEPGSVNKKISSYSPINTSARETLKQK